MIEMKEKEIDGRRFTVTQFNGREGFKIKTKLAKMLMPCVAAITGGIDTSKVRKGGSVMDADVDGEVLAKGLSLLAEQLHEDEFLALVMRLFQSTRMDDREITDTVFDMEFAGDFGVVYKALAFVLEVNYGSFLAVGGIGKVMRIMGKAANTAQ